MQYMLDDDDALSELKKSSDADQSGYSGNESSDKSFTLQKKQYKREQESSSSSKKYKRNKQQNQEKNLSNINQPKNDSSSLRMFLEELKNEENNHQSNRQLYNRKQPQKQDQSQKYSPSQTSMASSANIEIIKIQEESFSKIHYDIASLQNKIKGLENRLGPKPIQQHRTQESEVFQEKQLQSNRRYQEESRIMKYKNPQALQQKQPLPQTQENRFIDEKYHTQKENKENQFKPVQDEVSILTSESDTISYQTFPLRLKKQFQQQQQEIENKRVQLNERFNSQLLPQQKQQFQENQQVIRERFEYIKDQISNQSNQEPLQYEDQVRSLTETDFHFSPNNQSQQSFKMNDSTISVNEQTKKKIKEKVQKYKENHNRRRSMQTSQHNSLKRSQTHDYSRNHSSRGTSKKATKRQVRFSENKKSSRSRDALSNKKTHDLMAQELLDLRKQNAFLKLELEKTKKKQEMREDYYEKWKELKTKYKELESSYKVQEAKKKDQKLLIEEQKVDIKKLKKKVKTQKDKIKKLKGETPSTSYDIHDKQKASSKQVAKSYRQFKNEENEIKQKSNRKIQPSDVIRAKSKQKPIKRI